MKIDKDWVFYVIFALGLLAVSVAMAVLEFYAKIEILKQVLNGEI